MPTDRPGRVRETAARALSIVAHPAILMPLAIVGTAVGRGAPPAAVQVAAVASIAVVGAVLAYSYFRVRLGDWSHPDASRPSERLQLNRFLVVLLLAVSALSWALSQPRDVAVGALLCAAMVGVALRLRRRLKMSLHVAFALFAAALWWPGLAFVAHAFLAVGLAWSRWALRRHTPAEVLLGGIVGAAAGAAFRIHAGLSP